jgi:type VI protein secretion system component VasK
MLKGYLAFSPSDYTEASAIIAPMEYFWSYNLHDQPKLQQQLKYYLNLSVQTRLDELPLNRPLINKIRMQLQEIVPAERAYGLLTFKAAASDLADLEYASAIGSNFTRFLIIKIKLNLFQRYIPMPDSKKSL